MVCSTEAGSFFSANSDFARRFALGELTVQDASFLQDRGDVIDPSSGLEWEAFAHRVAQRISAPQRLDYLILVPTLRCNLSCDYCQVSRAAEKARGYDWDAATLEGVLRLIDSLTGPTIKIEFQGGEPTLRPDLIRAVIARCTRFERAEFVICTNLQKVTDEVLALFDRPDVFISTSLDGNPEQHERRRTKAKGQTDEFLANLDMLYRRYGRGKISALPTIDPANPPDPRSIIDAYSSFGIHSIFLRPINFHGFARSRFAGSAATPLAWTAYYESFVRELIRLNWENRDRVLQETYLSICLRKIFKPGFERHVDLRSPNPAGVDYLLIDHDGKFYPSDEARMLARSGVIDLAIGDVRNGFDGEKQSLLNRSASNTFDPDCERCVYQPYCGRDVIDDLARYGRIDLPRTETDFCRRHRRVFDFLFQLIFDPDPAVQHSLCRWLDLPGPVELFEEAP